MRRYAEVMVRPVLNRCPKVKPLVAAILAEAARQGATLGEFEKACDLAKSMVRNEMPGSSEVITDFARNAQATLESL